MKRSFLVCLVLLVFGGAVRAQHEHHGMAHKTAEGVKLDIRVDAAAQAITLRLGPLDLPAQTNHRGVAQAPDFVWVVPFDVWMVAYHPRLVDVARTERSLEVGATMFTGHYDQTETSARPTAGRRSGAL